MAGGDYDGDMYWVSRNPELLRYFKASESWANTCTSPNVIMKGPGDFSARFQPSKAMAIAADSWLSFMDRLLTLEHECDDEKNILRKKMLQLVDIYYDALDALEKGLEVNVPKELVFAKFPHYMGRGNISTYISKSVLGEIFDRADKLNLEEHCSIQVWKIPNFEDEIYGARLHSWKDHYIKFRHEMHEVCALDGELKKESAARVIHKYKQILYGADDLDKSSRLWDDIRLDALAPYRVTHGHAIEMKLASYCGFSWRVTGSALLKADACILYRLLRSLLARISTILGDFISLLAPNRLLCVCIAILQI